jgi:aryl-alcohol dehydrogenase-like predicted oxidoreductase
VRTIPLGALDRPVSCLALGTADWTEAERATAQDLADTFLELGGTLFDTARAYGEAESVLRAVLAERRDQAVVLTKGGHHVPRRFLGGVRRRVTPTEIAADLRASLDTLATDAVDVYLLHRDDPRLPVGPVVEALNEHVRDGRIGAFGVSNWTPERLDEAHAYAAERGLRGPEASSPQLSLLVWTEPPWLDCVTARDAASLVWHARTQTPLLAWSPLGAGFFSGGGDPAVVRVYETEANRRRRRLAEEVGRPHGATAAQVALAWLWARPFPVVAVVGPQTVAELREAVDATRLTLTEDELARLDGVEG